MAFTGSAVICQVTDSLVRITGLSLAKTAVGTISCGASGGDVNMPTTFKPEVYPYANALLVPSDVIDCQIVPAGSHVGTNLPYLVKAGATFATPFLITITNPDATNATPALEIWLKFHG